jgi:hypothetical protein
MIREAPKNARRPRAGRLAAAATLLAALAWPGVASANVGTPLMGVSGLHLLLGNIAIGIGEAFILRRLFGAPYRRAVPLLVASNYLSMIAGAVRVPFPVHAPGRVGFASGPALELAGGDLDSVPAALAILAAGSFTFTLVLEWPFCLEALGKRPHRLRDSVLGNLAAQSASYAVLGLIDFAASRTSLLGDLEFSRELVRALDPGTAVFFIGADDGALWRIGLDGSGREKLAAIDPRPAAGGEIETRDRALQPFAMAGWTFSGRGESAGEGIHFTLETPLLNLVPRNGTILPGDLVVAQIRDGIYVIDLNRRLIGPLTRGRSPLVGRRGETP